MLDLFYTSFNGTKKYVTNHIQSDKHRKVYEEQAKEILLYNFKDLDDCEYLINTEKQYVQNQKQSFWTADISELFHSSKQYKLMACDHALDIVHSLKSRFVTGSEGGKFYYKGLVM